MDKLSSMRVFLTIAREGSFSRAAELHGLSKAMASKHVKHLEDDLGVRLLNRSTRGVSLTEAGRNYRDRCDQILADLEEAESSLKAMEREPTGRIRVGSPPALGAFRVAPAIAEYIKRYPKTQVDLVLLDHAVDPIEGGFDVVLRIGELASSSYVARRLGDAGFLACASPEYLKANGRPAAPEDLLRHNCLRQSDTLLPPYWTFQRDGRPVHIKVKGNFKASLASAIRRAALRGLGIAYLPTYMIVNDISRRHLMWLFPELEPPLAPIHVIYPHRQHLSTRIQTFIEFLRGHIGDAGIGRLRVLSTASRYLAAPGEAISTVVDEAPATE